MECVYYYIKSCVQFLKLVKNLWKYANNQNHCYNRGNIEVFLPYPVTIFKIVLKIISKAPNTVPK